MSYGRNPDSTYVTSHSGSPEHSSAQSYGFNPSQKSQSPVYHEERRNPRPPYDSESTSNQEAERPLYSELYERLISPAEHNRTIDNKRNVASSRDQRGSGTGPYSASPLSTSNAYLGDPERRYECPGPEESYEYDGDAILQHYSDLSSLHSSEGYSDAQTYAHPVRHPRASHNRFEPSPFTTVPLLYRSLTTLGASGSDAPGHVEDSAPRYPQSVPAHYSVCEKDPASPNQNQDVHGSDHSRFNSPASDQGATARPFIPVHSQHQPVPYHRHSSYSELSANVAFLSNLATQGPSQVVSSDAPSPSSTVRPPDERNSELTPVSPVFRRPGPLVRGWKPSEDDDDDEYVEMPPRSCSPTPTPTPAPRLPVKHEPGRRRPSLACFFCRERKIACGRPDEGSADQTCNQCARRSFACDYPTESLRGQHRRGTRRKNRNHASIED